MILKDEEGKTQSETNVNLKTMRAYIKRHFTRMRGIWGIECIPDSVWADVNTSNETTMIKNEHQIKHWNSKIKISWGKHNL